MTTTLVPTSLAPPFCLSEPVPAPDYEAVWSRLDRDVDDSLRERARSCPPRPRRRVFDDVIATIAHARVTLAMLAWRATSDEPSRSAADVITTAHWFCVYVVTELSAVESLGDVDPAQAKVFARDAIRALDTLVVDLANVIDAPATMAYGDDLRSLVIDFGGLRFALAHCLE